MFDRNHTALVGSQRAEYQVELAQLAALVDHVGAGGRLALVAEVGHHFPERLGDFHATVKSVVIGEHWSGKYRGPGFPALGVVEDVVFEFQPGLLVEAAHLWRAVGEVKGVEVGGVRLVAPIGILAPYQVAAVQAIAGIELFTYLRLQG